MHARAVRGRMAESRRRLLSADKTLEIRHEAELGPSDDFYGVAEHHWRVVHRPTGRVVAEFEGSEYSDRWPGVRSVRFAEAGRSLIVTSGKGEEQVELPPAPA
jgi:hypothetical protein